MAELGDGTAQTLKNLTRPENWVNKFEVDGNGGQDPSKDVSGANWLEISQGITSITPTSNDTTSKNSFWNDKGYQETEVTGKQVTFQIKGYRVVGDPAQDYISGLFLKMGDDVRTLFRWTDQSGHVIIANATISKIQTMGGNANASQTFSFELALNGKPVESDGGTNNDDGTGLNGVQQSGQQTTVSQGTSSSVSLDGAEKA